MGFAFNGYCYATQSEAAAASCSQNFPVEYASGATLYVANCTGVNAAGSYTISRTANGASPTALTIPSGFPTCDWATFPSNPANLSPTDGAVVAAAVAGAWLVAWSWKAITQVLKDSTHSSDD